MENTKIDKLKQYIQQNPIVVGIFLSLQILFIILLAFTVSSIKTNTYGIPNIPVSNLSRDLEGIPKNSVETIQSALYAAVSVNQGTLSSISDSDAQIRDGSIINLYFESIDMHYISFIVDIPSIEQSYQIFNEWSNDTSNPNYLINMATMAMCPLKEQTIYANFKCRDRYNHNGQAFIVSEFLPYFNLDGYSIFTQYDKAPYIVIIAPDAFNIDNNTKNAYIEQTKEKVMSLGFPADIFSYYVSHGPEDSDLFLEYVISNQ